jgi:hypothetical protein
LSPRFDGLFTGTFCHLERTLKETCNEADGVFERPLVERTIPASLNIQIDELVS